MLSVPQKMLIARLLNRMLRLARGLVGRNMLVRCRRRTIEWDLDLDEGIDLSIYLLGAFEPRVLRAYTPVIAEGAVVFDIGANIGAHTLNFARLVGPNGRVFAIEPTDYAIAKLRRNLELNPELSARVTTHQCFLSAESTAVPPDEIPSSWPVTAPNDDPRQDAIGKARAVTSAVAITADDFFAQAGLDRLDFVKIDVDGNEHTVLRGFRSTLKRFRPTILIELAPYHYDGGHEAEFDELVRYLASLDYEFADVNDGRSVPSDPGALRRLVVPISGINALLRPRRATPSD
jgi:FkbM family methyltransferase